MQALQPVEYAYRDSSVSVSEKASAMCRRYQFDHVSQTRDDRIQYKHCDGTQLRLADSDLGSDEYRRNFYYVWREGPRGQLLFIFSTIVTITLHYYSDSVQGLPRLVFHAVPDDYNIWDGLRTNYRPTEVAAVPPDGEPAGLMNVNINVSFNTRKVLMYKSSADFQFAVSEVEFFTCDSKLILAVPLVLI